MKDIKTAIPEIDRTFAIDGPLDLLRGRRILLIVTGGVAAYKAADLARLLAKSGASVRTVMTEAAKRFVTPLTFSSLTGEQVASDMWAEVRGDDHIRHVALAEWAELLVVAPATADFLAKMAHGLADDLASSVALAFTGPKTVAPAMNTGMLMNPATQANLTLLGSRAIKILSSPEGRLASGAVGAGRMAEPKDIALEAAKAMGGGSLSGKTVLVTGGASRESWDEIRFLSNRSSGQMGLALSLAAWILGAEVVYLKGALAEKPDYSLSGFETRIFETTEDLLLKLSKAMPEKNPWALAMNAAPADFRPSDLVGGKISKSGESVPEIRLVRTPDILSSLGSFKEGCLFVGFAAENGDLEDRAKEKLRKKNLDYVAANQAGGPDSVFGSKNTELKLISAKLNIKAIGPASKFQVAWELWRSIIDGWS